MKKLAVILLMSLLLFNWCGYRLVSSVLEARSDERLEAQLDRNNYEESSLVEITVPLNLPYQVGTGDFTRVDGEISFNGVRYKYVKRKVVNDSMVLLCVPNHDKMKLIASKEDYFAKTVDLDHHKSGKSKDSASHLKSPFSDAELKPFDWSMRSIARNDAKSFVRNAHMITSHVPHFPGKPPKAFQIA